LPFAACNAIALAAAGPAMLPPRACVPRPVLPGRAPRRVPFEPAAGRMVAATGDETARDACHGEAYAVS